MDWAERQSVAQDPLYSSKAASGLWRGCAFHERAQEHESPPSEHGDIDRPLRCLPNEDNSKHYNRKQQCYCGPPQIGICVFCHLGSAKFDAASGFRVGELPGKFYKFDL
jgi:hypothetical protein